MMFGKVMATALAIGATGGAGLAVAENLGSAQAQDAIVQDISTASKPAGLCKPVAFRIYFEPGSARLTPEARDVIAAATREVSACDGVEFNLAADAGQIAAADSRRLASERSVAVLSAMRSRGVQGEVYVQPVSRTVIAAEKNAGPDFIELAVAPAAAPQLLSANTRHSGM
jgi:outer membrane protein OmpA-like peptidoglycan-associated protein